MEAFEELVKVLAHFCKNLDTADLVSVEAAITFGKICVRNEYAVVKMKKFLNESEDTHKKAAALRILVKQFNESEWSLVENVLQQFTSSPVWEYRREAAQLLQHLGLRHACPDDEAITRVYNILEQRLWDDSVELVRLESAKTLVSLGMYPKAAEVVVKRLTDTNETQRAHAATSLGTLGIKHNKVVRYLLEMLELDPSDRVRREVIRTFGMLGITDKKVMRVLREREKGEGILSTEAKRVLNRLETTQQVSV